MQFAPQTVNASKLLGWEDKVGSLDKDKFADIIAVDGDPLKDVTELEREVGDEGAK